MTTESADTKRLMRKNYEQPYARKFDNLCEMHRLLKAQTNTTHSKTKKELE